METLYRKVVINCKEDLPNESGYYIAGTTDNILDAERVYFQGRKQDYVDVYHWYLIEQDQQAPEKSVEEILGDKFNHYKNWMPNNDADNLIKDIIKSMEEYAQLRSEQFQVDNFNRKRNGTNSKIH